MSIAGFDTARKLVHERFPQARAAWLGGSTVLGTATPTSDLDITVLLAGPPAPYRESLRYHRWPVELFVHTESSMEYFLATERTARKPTTLRLIGQTQILLDSDGSGAYLQEKCAALLAAGPEPLGVEELRAERYGLTDLLDDLVGSRDDDERLLIAFGLWRATAELVLTGHGRWMGSGKWLHRELASFDREAGTDYSHALARGVRSVAHGTIEPLVGIVTRALHEFGGPLFDGFKADGPG
ncbi:nucleotidyltransferase domain-containing protein [Nocardia flavorosea]|uniref:nucleotidyltransferase domain-containing protein n=1 Tax=Nocardia flavorosea TaxID=53429 RepID=UPI002455D6E4|nr:nucleotidyltransferase domain-containing protein [Nocardia flavorosea]